MADAFFEIGTSPARSCYNCSHGCKAVRPALAFGCPLWMPDRGTFVPTETELQGLGLRPSVMIADESAPFGRKEWDAVSDMLAERKKEREDK